jgi:hypothetical protein
MAKGIDVALPCIDISATGLYALESCIAHIGSPVPEVQYLALASRAGVFEPTFSHHHPCAT